MFHRKSGGHYSPRRSDRSRAMWKIVLAYTDGSSYDDIDTDELFENFDQANLIANKMNKSRKGEL